MQNYLSAVELGYRLPDGRFLFNNLTFSFSAVRAGLVGANGIGKTTLLEILVGAREPSIGAVNRCGRVSYLPQQARFGSSATVADAINLAEQIAALERVERGEGRPGDFDSIADRWDLREQREVERDAAEQTLQSAQQRFKEAKLIAQRARERQQRKLSNSGRNSFKRNLPPIVAGNWRRAAENTAARIDDRHQRKVDHAKQEVDGARKNLPIELQIAVDLERSKVPSNKRMIELFEVNYRYPNAERPLWNEPLRFEVIGPERIWLKGANGTGKSTLIELIGGWKSPSEGVIRVGAERMGMIDQRMSALDDSLTILENLKRAAPMRPERELRALLGRFLFIRDAALKPASVLSGGERMRAGLACLLGADQAPEILIADEPTNNLDLPSVEELVSALRNFGGVLIVVSHDTTFIEEVWIERVIDLDQ